MSTAHALAPFVLADDEGAPVELGTLWRDRIAVLVYVRHFGCLLCREQVSRLSRIVPELRALGANVVVVGSGRPQFARAFREDLALDVPILVDPDLVSYRAAGMQRTLRATVSLGLLKNAWRAYRAGHRQRAVEGDPWQQGGVLVLGPGDRDVYTYISQVAGDHPDEAEIVAAVRRATAERASSSAA